MKKILTYFLLPALVLFLGYLIYAGIKEPVDFEKSRKERESVAIERLKDIRTLQVAYKGKFGIFSESLDTLMDFYRNGQITIIKQIGSLDDSVAVAQKKVYRDSVKIAVKDTLLTRKNFIIDSICFIPFSGGEKFDMKAEIRKVSNVDVPLFEASAHYKQLLKGLDRQLIINLCADREGSSRYPGLKVGSVEAPNNNAGNWE